MLLRCAIFLLIGGLVDFSDSLSSDQIASNDNVSPEEECLKDDGAWRKETLSGFKSFLREKREGLEVYYNCIKEKAEEKAAMSEANFNEDTQPQYEDVSESNAAQIGLEGVEHEGSQTLSGQKELGQQEESLEENVDDLFGDDVTFFYKLDDSVFDAAYHGLEKRYEKISGEFAGKRVEVICGRYEIYSVTDATDLEENPEGDLKGYNVGCKFALEQDSEEELA